MMTFFSGNYPVFRFSKLLQDGLVFDASILNPQLSFEILNFVPDLVSEYQQYQEATVDDDDDDYDDDRNNDDYEERDDDY